MIRKAIRWIKHQRMRRQRDFCNKNRVPMFAPEDGVCFFCKRRIKDKGDEHITGCEHCHYTYCG